MGRYVMQVTIIDVEKGTGEVIAKSTLQIDLTDRRDCKAVSSICTETVIADARRKERIS